MTTARKPIVRCAIYTRKSSDEGLEQEFNSLEAQREACEAYIRSQAHEGWRALPERFDDGGHSGGTLERPALQQLLELVRAKRVNVIVIYKIDRLTRSLADFARLAELFDQYGVSFVSVTQQFNTTTSMGRLMLNVLLSFAQFERELTGERIRDKIAASKKKGMWMGGCVPLGYDAKERTLVINEAEAKVVRTLFQLYLEHGSIKAVWQESHRRNFRSKIRTLSSGRQTGGSLFFPGQIHYMLKNPIYVGRISHKGQIHPGNHPPLIDEATWNAVQVKLAENLAGERRGRNRKDRHPLTGLLVDEGGTAFVPTHTVKDGKPYRYYIARPILPDGTPSTAKAPRIPAEEIEAVVLIGLRDLLCDQARLLGALEIPNDTSGGIERVLQHAHSLLKSSRASAEAAWQSFRPLLQQVIVGGEAVTLCLSRTTLRTSFGLPDQDDKIKRDVYEVAIKTRVRMRGARMKLMVGNHRDAAPSELNTALIKALARAHAWFERLRSGQARSVGEIARTEGLTISYVRRVLRLAFLSPEVVEAVVERHAPLTRLMHQLISEERLNVDWREHQKLLLKVPA